MNFLNKFLKIFVSLGLGAIVLLLAYLISPRNANEHDLTIASTNRDAQITERYFTLPTLFEENRGQIQDPSVLYFSRGLRHDYFFTPDAVLLNIQGCSKQVDPSRITFKFIGKESNVSLRSTDLLPSKSHYLVGSDSTHWMKNVPNYAKVIYKSIYSGVDAYFYGNNSTIEYDLVVAPHAETQQIKLSLSGVQKFSFDEQGNLRLSIGEDIQITMHKPNSYQLIDGQKHSVESCYHLLASNDTECVLGFSLGHYNPNLPLIIDPVITYSSYFGGTGSTSCNGVAVDNDGNAYLTGWMTVPNTGNQEIFVSKINSTGDAVLYTTHLGTGSPDDSGKGITVDKQGNAYVTGNTQCFDFPTKGTNLSNGLTPGERLTGFVSVLNPEGSDFIYSTLIGGSNGCVSYSIAADEQGNAFVTGQTSSVNFPTKNPLFAANVALGCETSAFVTAIAHDGSELVYSTYLGGSGYTVSHGIAVDKKGNAYVTGITTSDDFPKKGHLLSSTVNDNGTVFVTKINPTGSDLIYSTLIGNSSSRGLSQGNAIATDSHGNAYVTGITYDTKFPRKGINLSPTADPQYGVAFVTSINSKGSSLRYSSLIGGSNSTAEKLPIVTYNGISYHKAMTLGNGISVDGCGNAYITGQTCCTDFPHKGKPISPQAVPEQGIAFVTAVKSEGRELLYSTLLGGGGGTLGNSIAVSKKGRAYVTGQTYSMDFPTTQTPLTPALYPPDGVGFITSIAPVTPN